MSTLERIKSRDELSMRKSFSNPPYKGIVLMPSDVLGATIISGSIGSVRMTSTENDSVGITYVTKNDVVYYPASIPAVTTFLVPAQKISNISVPVADRRIEMEKASLDNAISFFREQNIEIKNERSIRSFLKVNPVLQELVPQTIQKVKEYFQQNSKHLALEVFYDPDDESAEGELFLIIETSCSIEKAVAILQEFTRQWFIPAMGKQVRNFSVDVA